MTQGYKYAGSMHPVHSSKGAGKGYPLITKFDSSTNTTFIALMFNRQRKVVYDSPNGVMRYDGYAVAVIAYALRGNHHNVGRI